jgi:UDP-N-acetylmuramoyl-L-alanyl-D-glutamate--2,6-diaminopimelate ligase
MFCAVPGDHVDGHDLAYDAVARGASCLAVQRWLPFDVPQVLVPSTRAALGTLAAALHGNPADAMALIGVTGTNGKTTTTHLLQSALDSSGRRSGLLGTVENRWGAWSEPSFLTTPEPPELHKLLARMRTHGVDSVAMEVSSQGLDQHRVNGLMFDVAVWLNLAEEHLDYHGTMEQYYASKALLLEPKRARRGLVCIDDEWGRRLASHATIPVVTFGRSPWADVQVDVLSATLDGTRVRLSGVDGGVELEAPVVGAITACDIAAAYLAARWLGAEPSAVARGIATCSWVPGRFERVDAGQPFMVIVDYAHTPDALERLIRTARSLTQPGGQIHLVLGCRGGKDRFKRPTTGRVVATADHPILTTDDPDGEDPAAIVDQVLVGVIDIPHDHIRVELDRRAAIRLAISSAAPGDVVLITGRGHERRRHLGSDVEYFDDRAVAAEALANAGFSPVLQAVPSSASAPSR